MKMSWGSWVAAGLLMSASVAWGQTAVIETNHREHYVPANFNGFTMTEGYAPLPVFFEGWKSTPRADIVDWKWNFGDGTAEFHGFNAGHVFEFPGTYVTTLTVTTTGGQTASTTTTVTVLPRDGQTYYVDSSIGDDANDGLTQATPWRTATHAFMGLANHRYNPGDEILFKRGEVYEMHGQDTKDRYEGVYIHHGTSGWGMRFASYGEGPRPLLKNSGTLDGTFIYGFGKGQYRITIQDLDIDLENAAGDRIAIFYDVREDAHNLLFWRLNFRNCNGTVYFSGNVHAQRISNVFLHESSVKYSERIMLWTRATRVSMIGNLFDWAENHIHYGSWIDTGVIADNVHSRPAWGRTALRVSALSDDFNIPSKNVHIIRNYFGGHIDPLDSSSGEAGAHLDNPTRYNYQMVFLAPNKANHDSGMQDIIFEKNVITNCEQAMVVGSYKDSIIRDNLILTSDNYGDAPRITLGHKYEDRPLLNIEVSNNTIISNESRSGRAGMIAIQPYIRDPFNGQADHLNLSIVNNHFYSMNNDKPNVWYDYSRHPIYKNDSTAGHAALVALNQGVTINNNTYHRETEDLHGYAGGYWNTPSTHGVVHDLTSWRNTYGQDANATYLPRDTKPYPAQVYSEPVSYLSSITVDFDGGLDATRNPVAQVYLWVKRDNGPWQDAGLSPQPGPSGSFAYVPATLGRYNFATVSVDTNGVQSITPNELPTPFANTWTNVLATDGTPPPPPPPPDPDETAPVTGPAVSPASTYGNPVVVTYSGAQDNSGGSGLKEVHLWVKQGSGGTWTDSGQTATGASGAFSYTMPALGTYFFAVQAEDNEGLLSPAPTGSGDTNTLYDEPAAGMLLHLELDDSPTDNVTDDSSGLDNDGSLVSHRRPALDPAGKIGAAYAFTADYVDLGGFDVPGSAMTISAWINGDNYNDTYRRIIAKANGIPSANTWWGLTTTSPANKMRFQLRTTDEVLSEVVGSTEFQPGVWYHIAGVYDGSIMRLYVNGVEEASMVKSGAVATDSSVTAFVADCPPIAGARSFPGKIDDVRIYNIALSEEEIAELALLDVPEPEPEDTEAPNPGTASSPSLANTWPITINYAGASDAMSGLQTVALWAKVGSGAWSNTGQTSGTAAGAFSYTGSADGTYQFALRATDVAGNESAMPTGSGQTQTQYDSTAPGVGTVTVSAQSTNPVNVSFSGVQDTANGSGLATVQLWAKQGNGAWSDTGLTSTQGAGSLVWNGATSDATYNFALRTIDNASNISSVPTGAGQASTVVDSSPPDAGTVTARESETTVSPIVLDYSGVTDEGSGLEFVQLWFKKNAGGSWGASGLSQSSSSGTFSFTGLSGDATYYFALRVQDNSGNLSPAPSGAGDTHVKFDTTPPTKGTMSVTGANLSSSPIQVSYSGVADALSSLQQVQLWVKQGGGAWTNTGDTRATGSGAFSYSAPSDGDYAFDVVVKDSLNNTSPNPTGSGLATTKLDTETPEPGTLTGPESITEGPLSLSYTGASDGGSGLKRVYLWYKSPGSAWIKKSSFQTAASGSFNHNAFSSDGEYGFSLQAEDNAGNKSPAPSGAGDLIVSFDGTAPTPPTVTAPENANASPVTVSYSGATDPGGAIKEVRLWTRKGAGAWSDSGQLATTASGSFDVTLPADDTYYFDVQVEDEAGNTSAEPSGDGQASTVLDTTAPAEGSATAPESASEVPINVTYTSEAGVDKTYLWFKKDSGSWTNSGLSANGESGAFAFNGVTGDGTYAFAVQTEDSQGNKSDTPTGAGSDSTIFDSEAPTKPTLSGTSPTGDSPIVVTYSGATDAASAISEVALWFKKGTAGVWAAAAVTPGTTESGTFNFTEMSGDDTYHFSTRVTDTAGNETVAPSGAGGLQVVYDGAAPTAGVASAPESASTSPITVSFAGASDEGSGLASVELWVRQDAGPWQASGLPAQSTGSGSFAFAPSADGTYYFALRATDDLGNESDEPTGDGDTSTNYDSTPPSGVALTAPASADATPIAVQYTGDADVARVELFFKKDGGAWTQSAASATGATGTLNFSDVSGDGVYAFDVVAYDDMDNPTDPPAGSGAASTTYDTTAPTPGTVTVPAQVSNSTANVAYSGVTDTLSPVALVTLWVKKGDAGAWQSTGLTRTGAAGSFTFTNFTGDDTYYFDIVAEDEVGNASDEPTGNGRASTTSDNNAPTVGTLTAPELLTAGPVNITYSGMSDDGSGLKSVSLWVRKGPGGWSNSGLSQATESGSFSYTSLTGDSRYYFAVVTEDNAGNQSDLPTGDGQDSTIIDGTPPSSATASAEQYATDSPVSVTYTASEPAETFEAVYAWVRKGTGPWTMAEGPLGTASGTWSYSGMTGDDTYHFHFQVEDTAGNKSPDPTAGGAASVTFDSIAPSVGSMTVNGEYDTDNPIDLAFSGVNDTTSGLKQIELWVKPPNGSWQATSTTANGASGVLTYTAAAGDGEYAFGIVAEDNAGNRSPDPAGEGAAQVTFDATAPTTGSLTGPEFVDASPIELTYSGVTDEGSGLESVRLYVKKDSGNWAAANPEVSDTAESGTLSYSPTAGDGTYAFALRSKDNAGNESAVPTGPGALTVHFDTSPPEVGTITAPEHTNSGPITVEFSGVSDAESGIKLVTLFAKKDGGVWNDTGLTSTGSSGSFAYDPQAGEGNYAFALKAEDNAGVTSPDPSGAGQATTFFDTTNPSAGTLDAPASADSAPISILYSGVSDSGSGVDRVHLWFKKGSAGSWSDSGEIAFGESGSFSFTGVTDDDTYFFALRAEDSAGNLSDAPTGDGQASTSLDTSFTGGAATTEPYAKSLPIAVSFDGAGGPNDSAVDVYLWVKQGADGTWADTGLAPIRAANGQFLYEGATEEGEYFFAVQAEDDNGDRTAEPFGNGDTSTIYDETAPTPVSLQTPEATNQAPITMEYAVEEDTGSGLKEVRIWVKPGIDGIWEQTTLIQAGVEGSFDYPDVTEENVYFFYLQTVDNAGNTSPIPTDETVFAPLP